MHTNNLRDQVSPSLPMVSYRLLTDPLALEHLNLVTSALAGHDLGILFFQGGLDDRLELFHETVLPFTERTCVVGADVGNRVDGEFRTGTGVHRIDDKAKRRDKTTGENYPPLR